MSNPNPNSYSNPNPNPSVVDYDREWFQERSQPWSTVINRGRSID